jgi:hypothetical protein
MQVESLDWNDADHRGALLAKHPSKFDVIFGTDVVYTGALRFLPCI